jgi:L-threonylcarbamoyladenylate synthase
MNFKIRQACHVLKEGKLLVYPTESVFGVGCLANNDDALIHLRSVKGRSSAKGFIVLCASMAQLQNSFPELELDQKAQSRLVEPQKHPTTWLIPFSKPLNPLLVGNNHSLAVRITQHPVAKVLCESCGPIVSSSANPAGMAAPKTLLQAKKQLGDTVDFYLNESLGEAKKTSQIIDLRSGEIVRRA